MNKDKQIVIDALEAAKKYEAGFRVGGLVVLDRHREAGEKIPAEVCANRPVQNPALGIVQSSNLLVCHSSW